MAPRKRTRATVEDVIPDAPASDATVAEAVASVSSKKAKTVETKTIVIEHCKSW